MLITKTRIQVGADSPFRALHMTDNHIALADARDGERKMRLAESRSEAFGGADRLTALFQKQLSYAKENRLPILHTGDICDFVSYKNLEFVSDALRDTDFFMAAGNHEFSLYVGEAFEDTAYKMQSYDLVQSYFGMNLLFDSRVIHGVNFVAVDNSYYRFDSSQLEKLRAETEKGLPIVLMLHCPLHTDTIYDFMIKSGKPCAYLTGTPESYMKNYSEHRLLQQRPDQATLSFMDFVYSSKEIRAVLAGHLHENAESPLPSGIMQYVTGGGFAALAREIEFI